ncbi:MAG: PIN domain-containing protein [bacterium]|nr:PIN domain-containing protein [bacterium]MDZ4284681.1 PIN domain-containing protein [Patescibacteria group bacterium]
MICFLDSNIVLRFLVPEDQKIHSECARLFDLVEARGIEARTSSCVCAEVVWVLRGGVYQFSKEKATEALRSFDAIGITLDDRIQMRLALNLYAAHSVKFVDALIASNPGLQDGSLALVSYDKDFDKLGIDRHEPLAILKKYGNDRQHGGRS